ncbi:uncharacterized protein TRIADDRAFT_52330 [Trichoplax adhaerens]|uniref:Uncharacterized protein n=1 Tax=Trichoplax adhaerens TaxID=10228 RepID=B3RHZ8_TRIAD|nr:hypothetical protein TRIADDRAFT_52330 [Trichoplax adhaerens]EDV28950.1 hypothetical protein TRIADDRAFT_52330 [Trichoplax adhaerens]|eukprot:XP_002108152.1 hypothetical protein TRIADDRAFT_52330 [Trichoplax adhaerens]
MMDASQPGKLEDYQRLLLQPFLSKRLENELYNKLMNYCEKERDSHSLFQLGCLYQQGLGKCEKDLHKAKQLLDNAAKLGHARAMYNLCQLYGSQPSAQFANVVSESELIDIKVHWYIESSSQALVYSNSGIELWSNYNASVAWRKAVMAERARLLDRISQKDYQDILQLGKLMNQVSYIALQLSTDDSGYKTAIDGLESACRLGSADAYWNLAALVYHNGLGVNKDEEKKLQLMYQAADSNHVRAQFWLGEYLFSSLVGMEEQCTKALKYMKQSLQYPFASTLFWIGYGHLLGTGVSQNYALAVQYFQLAAVSSDYLFGIGNSSACSWLAFMYTKGLGMTIDFTMASHYYAMAAKSGNKHSFNDLAKLIEKRKISCCELDIAIKLYSIGAGENVEDTSSYYARLRLGKIYSNKRYHKIYNQEKATEYFTQALHLLKSSVCKDTRSYRYYHLGIIYENGYNTDVDYSQAAKYYSLAKEAAAKVYDILDRYYGKKAEKRLTKIMNLTLAKKESKQTTV